MLDLTHDVVAEVTHHPALQRRQVGDDRRAIGGDQRIERGEHALIERNIGRQRRAAERDATVAQFERRDRVATNEAVARPALAVLDGFEQEALTIADQLEVCGYRGFKVAQHFRPHRHHRVVGR